MINILYFIKKTLRMTAAAMYCAACFSLLACVGTYGSGNDDSIITENSYPYTMIEKSDNAKRLFNYLTDIYSHYTLSGQMDLTWDDSVDMAGRVYRDTGKYPVIMGYDFMNIDLAYSGYGKNQTDEAIAWWKGTSGRAGLPPGKNGIVTFCWHWRNPRPTGLTSDDNKDAFYVKSASDPDKPYTTYRIPYNVLEKTWKTDSSDYTYMMQDLDRIAADLKKLQDQGVPVLWRPLHEASGGWFWWGGLGKTSYKALWRKMVEYFEQEKGLNNLIWVWNGQSADWYPGDDWVDIIGEDVYDSSKFDDKFTAAVTYSDNPAVNPIMAALTENGLIPDPDKMTADNNRWLWFMTWNDSALNNNGPFSSGDFWSYVNVLSHRQKVYSHASILTLDEIPVLSDYPIE